MTSKPSEIFFPLLSLSALAIVIYNNIIYYIPEHVINALLLLIFCPISLTLIKSKRKIIRYTAYAAWLLLVLALINFVYFNETKQVLGFMEIHDYILGIFAIVSVIVLCAIFAVPIISLISVGMLAYALISGFDLLYLISVVYMSLDGILGNIFSLVVSFIFLFMIFGSLLRVLGMETLFHSLARALSKLRGGASNFATIGSGLFGSVSGSVLSNVYTTGSITIPLMKKQGFKPHEAVGIEVASSLGGFIMPPIMGVAAFIMSEFTGIPYIQIATASIIPAIMYYASIYLHLHVKISKNPELGKYVPEIQSEPHARSDLIRSSIVLLSGIGVLLYLLVNLYSIAYSVTVTVLATMVIGIITLPNRSRTLLKILQGIYDGLRDSVMVVMLFACLGVIIGVLSATGLGIQISNLVYTYGKLNIALGLFLTFFASLILGMGTDIIASYILVAILAAPALIDLGIPVLLAHLFILWMALDAAVSPPVAIVSQAAARFGGAPMLKTMLYAWYMAKPIYIIPTLAIFTPLIPGFGSPNETLLAIVTGFYGIACIIFTIEGWFLGKLSILERFILGITALALWSPELRYDLLGMGVASGLLLGRFLMWVRTRKPFHRANSIRRY